MPVLTERLKLPLPLSNEYVKRESLNKIFEEIDRQVATVDDNKEVFEYAKDRTEDGFPKRSGKDENGIFTIYEERQDDGKLIKKSVLSSPNADGNYLVRTVTYYKDGTAYKTKVSDLKYDDDGDFVEAVPR